MWSFVVTAPSDVQKATASFLSVVAYNPTKDRSVPDEQKVTNAKGTHLLVRARVKEHLEPLLPYAEGSIGIQDDGRADYRWRLILRREEYIAFTIDRINDITYDSHFKEAFRDHARPEERSGLYSSLMSIWSIMIGHQRGKWSSYGTSWKGSGTKYTGTGTSKKSGKGSATTGGSQASIWDEAWDEWTGGYGNSNYGSSSSGNGYPWDRRPKESLDEKLAGEEPDTVLDLDKLLDNMPKFSDSGVDDNHFEKVNWPPKWSEEDKNLAYFPEPTQAETKTVEDMLHFLRRNTAWSITPERLGQCDVDSWEIWRAAAKLTPEEVPVIDVMDEVLAEAHLLTEYVDLMEKIWVVSVDQKSTNDSAKAAKSENTGEGVIV